LFFLCFGVGRGEPDWSCGRPVCGSTRGGLGRGLRPLSWFCESERWCDTGFLRGFGLCSWELLSGPVERGGRVRGLRPSSCTW
jgi:hypothetical protein